jgi:hypothetical protein
MLRFRRAFPAGPLEGITVEIGDRCPTALDQSYLSYTNWVKTYRIEPACFTVWLRVHGGVNPHSRATGVRLISGVEHQRRKAERAKAASAALSSLIEA